LIFGNKKFLPNNLPIIINIKYYDYEQYYFTNNIETISSNIHFNEAVKIKISSSEKITKIICYSGNILCEKDHFSG